MEQSLTADFAIGRAVECLARAEEYADDLADLLKARDFIDSEIARRHALGAVASDAGVQLDIFGASEASDEIGSPAAVRAAATRAECVHGVKLFGEECEACADSQRERVERHRATHCIHDVPNELPCMRCHNGGESSGCAAA